MLINKFTESMVSQIENYMIMNLYRVKGYKKEYWRIFDNGDGYHTIHWGELGTVGQLKIVRSTTIKAQKELIQNEIDTILAEGFHIINSEHLQPIIIEYKIDGIGTSDDLDKRHRLEERMNKTLNSTGLGFCDSGSTERGRMEVCNFVVDLETAKAVIEKDLEDTEFANFTRIYNPNKMH